MSARRTKKERTPSVTNVIIFFLELINTIKIFHWTTASYAQHKASDELVAALQEHTDSFIEKLIARGPAAARRTVPKSITLKVGAGGNIGNYISSAKRRVAAMSGGADLESIRDDIVADLSQFEYLLSLR